MTTNLPDQASNLLDPSFVPPLRIPLQHLRVTYRVTFDEFLDAARRAARQLGQGQSGGSVTWEIDGYNSNYLYLKRWRIEQYGPYSHPYQTSFELDMKATSVTVGVFSRWESDLSLFHAFLWQLDIFLPRKRM